MMTHKNTIDSIPNVELIWNLFKNLLQSHGLSAKTSQVGRPTRDPKQIFYGCIYILRSGCAWRLLPQEFGPYTTCHPYFLKWVKLGLFEELWKLIRKLATDFSNIDRRIEIIDATERHVKNLETKKSGFGYKIKGKRSIKITIIQDYKGYLVGLDVHKSGPHDVTR